MTLLDLLSRLQGIGIELSHDSPTGRWCGIKEVGLKCISVKHNIFSGFYSPTNMGLLDAETKDGRIIFFLPWEGYTVST